MATVHFAALRYLDQWYNEEAPLRSRLLAASHEDRLDVLGEAAAYFRIARNLPTRHDEGRGLRRYEPVAKALELLPERVADAAVFVPGFAARLSAHYGGQGTLSFSSKLLWLWYQDPIVIYDARVRKALKTPEGDYAAYYAAWDDVWQRLLSEIARACGELPALLRYAECGARLRPEQAQEVVRQPWFQRRVLDVKLWYEGA